jgi:hypothetical protein
MPTSKNLTSEPSGLSLENDVEMPVTGLTFHGTKPITSRHVWVGENAAFLSRNRLAIVCSSRLGQILTVECESFEKLER